MGHPDSDTQCDDPGPETSFGIKNFSREQLNEMFSLAYEELRRLAFTVKQSDGSITLNPTALVNEAWLKLASSPPFATTSKLHFKRIAARAMRQVLVEAARRRSSQKRGQSSVVALYDCPAPAECEQDVLGLNRALDDLERLRPRQAIVVESRFFGGLEVPEIAECLAISEATVVRDWRAAKAWLAQELRR